MTEGDGEWGLCSVHNTLFLMLLLLLLFPCSSVGSLPWNPVLHKLLQQSHRMQFIRNGCLQCDSQMGPQVLTSKPDLAWTALHGTQALQVPATAWGLHEITASFRTYPSAPIWGPLWASGGYLLHHGPPWAAGAQPTSPWSSPQTAGESLLQCLEHLLSLLLHWPWCQQSCCSHIFLLLCHSCCTFFSLS